MSNIEKDTERVAKVMYEAVTRKRPKNPLNVSETALVHGAALAFKAIVLAVAEQSDRPQEDIMADAIAFITE